jgi:hypothetical protein
MFILFNMKKLYFLLLSSGVLSACDKEKDTPNMSYPTTFVSKQLYNTTPVRMYTRQGEVKDAARIKAFAGKWSTWYHLENKKVDATSNEKFVFVNATSVEIKDGGDPKSFEVKKVGDDLVLTAKEEFDGQCGLGEEFYFDFLRGISKYKQPVHDKKVMPYFTGIAYTYKSKEQLAVALKGDELQVYQMLSTLKSGDQYRYSVRSTLVHNRFDATGISMLHDNDTLTVQEFVAEGVKEQ